MRKLVAFITFFKKGNFLWRYHAICSVYML